MAVQIFDFVSGILSCSSYFLCSFIFLYIILGIYRQVLRDPPKASSDGPKQMKRATDKGNVSHSKLPISSTFLVGISWTVRAIVPTWHQWFERPYGRQNPFQLTKKWRMPSVECSKKMSAGRCNIGIPKLTPNAWNRMEITLKNSDTLV